jgi:hypothetical protein
VYKSWKSWKLQNEVARVHENWAKPWYAHVILAKNHSAGQHRVKRTFGKKRESATRGHPCTSHESHASRKMSSPVYMKTGQNHGTRM